MTALRLTRATRDILQVLGDASPAAPEWGLTICWKTGRGPGTVYPILQRLEECGWVAADNVDSSDPRISGRRYYELTSHGHRMRQSVLVPSRLQRFLRAVTGVKPFGRWTRVAIDIADYACERHIADENFEFYGLEAVRALDYGPGSVYPALSRMERAGWLLSRLEEETQPRKEARPPRVYYRINPDNLVAVRQRVAELDAARQRQRHATSVSI